MEILKGKNTIPRHSTPKKYFYLNISNTYATLAQYAADPPKTTEPHSTPYHLSLLAIHSTFKYKAQCRLQAHQVKRAQKANEDALLDQHISWAKD